MPTIIINKKYALLLLLPLVILASHSAFAHNVSAEDIARIGGKSGMQLPLYLWLGAKHMVTGYDHLLFLLGVIFYLKNLREIVTLVSLFALGHSITLIGGVLAGLDISPYLVDAIIGFSVAYKGFDNLNGFSSLFGERPSEKIAVLVFGLFHGLGLATKLQDLGLHPDGLFANLLAFNVGVEIGQIIALIVLVVLFRLTGELRKQPRFAIPVNVGLIVAGFALMAWQFAQYASN